MMCKCPIRAIEYYVNVSFDKGGEMMKTVCDAVAICKAIAVDFKVKGLTHEAAASRLGCSKQTVSNQISGKKKFSLKSAQKYAETFGYNLEFLLFGKGELNSSSSGLVSVDEAPSVQESDECSASISVKQLNQIQDLLRVLNNNDACDAFEAVLNGDERKYLSLYNKLRRDFGWELGLVADQEFLDKIRRVLSDVQESRAKILASYIDDVMTSGGFYRIQTLMDDCKKDILRLQKEYPEYIQGDLD